MIFHYLPNWFISGILSIFLFNTLYHMNNTSIDVIRHEKSKVILRQNFKRFETNAKYQVIKIGKYVSLQSYTQIHKIFLDRQHMTIFTLIVNATRTIQCVMNQGIIIYITGEGQISEQMFVITKPGSLTFEVPAVYFSLRFHITEPIKMIWKGKHYSNVLCICRQYF